MWFSSVQGSLSLSLSFAHLVSGNTNISCIPPGNLQFFPSFRCVDSKCCMSKCTCALFQIAQCNPQAQAPIYSQGWSLDLYTGPGTCIGTGTVPANMDMSSCALGRVVLSTGCDSGTGMITPHSQLRQVSLKPPVDLSLDMRPLDGNQAPSSGRQVTTAAGDTVSL